MSAPMEITDLAVTYKDVMAPVGYRKVTSGFGDATVAADLNNGNGGTQVYLWYAAREESPPVSEIVVLYDDEETPEGFHKLDKDLTKGVDSRVYVAFKRVPAQPAADGSEQQVVQALTVEFSEASPGEGWTRVDRNLCRTDEGSVYLWCKIGARQIRKKWDPSELKLEDYLDCLDTASKWCGAQVIRVNKEANTIRVHYLGWADRWDEDIDIVKQRHRVAEFQTKSDSSYRPDVKTQGIALDLTAEAVEEFRVKLERYRAGELEGEDEDKFWNGDLQQMIENCLSRDITDRAVLPSVWALMKDVMDTFVELIRGEQPVPDHVCGFVAKMFGTDKNFTWFYTHNGFPGDALAAPLLEDQQFVRKLALPAAEDPTAAGGRDASASGAEGAAGASTEAPAGAGEAEGEEADGPEASGPRAEGEDGGGEAASKSKGAGKDKAGAEPRVKLGTVHESSLLVSMANMFGRMGGFEAVLGALEACNAELSETAARLPPAAEGSASPSVGGAGAAAPAGGGGAKEPRVTIGNLQMFLTIMSNFADMFVEGFARSYFPRLQHAALERLRRLSDAELQQLEREELDGVLGSLERVLVATLEGHFAADETRERFALDMALRLLTCPFLNKQLRGAEDLAGLLKRVRKAERVAAQEAAGTGAGTAAAGTGAGDSSDSEDGGAGAGSGAGAGVGSASLGRPNPLYGGGGAYHVYGQSLRPGAGLGYGAGYASYGRRRPRTRPTSYLRASHMVAWLREHRIVRLLLQGTATQAAHVALVKKGAPPVLAFLAAQRQVTTGDLEVLWQAGASENDQQADAVFGMVEKLASRLTGEQCEFLYERIAQLPLSQYREQTLEMLVAFTRVAVATANGLLEDGGGAGEGAAGGGVSNEERVAREGEALSVEGAKLFGMELLYRSFRPSTDLAGPLKAQAMDQLCALLRDYPAASPRFVRRAAADVSAAASVDDVTAVLRFVLHVLQQMVPSKRAVLVEELVGEQLIQHMVGEVKRLADDAALLELLRGPGGRGVLVRQGSAQLDLRDDEDDPDDFAAAAAEEEEEEDAEEGKGGASAGGAGREASPALAPVASALEKRLDVIRYVLRHSEQTLHASEVDALWQALVPGGRCTLLSNVFFRWLRRAAVPELTESPSNAAPGVVLDDATITHVFTTLMCGGEALDVATLSLAGFKCFDALMRKVGEQELSLYLPFNLQFGCVLDVEAVSGLDALWEVLLHARSARVASEAQVALVDLHTRLSRRCARTDPIWTRFVGKCLDNLHGACGRVEEALAEAGAGGAGGGLGGARRSIARVLSLLMHFVQSAQRVDLKRYHPSDPEMLVGARVVVRWEGGHYYAGTITDYIAHSGKHHITYDDGDQRYYRMVRKTFEVVTLSDAQRAWVAEVTKEATMESHQVLAHDARAFDVLFRVLALPLPAVVEQAWHLLCSLPPNAVVAGRILALGAADGAAEPDWAAALPAESPMRLLYSLRQLHGFLMGRVDGGRGATTAEAAAGGAEEVKEAAAGEAAASAAETHAWGLRFVQRGGFRYLLHLLVAFDLTSLAGPASALPQEALKLLVHLIEHIVGGSEGEAGAGAGEDEGTGAGAGAGAGAGGASGTQVALSHHPEVSAAVLSVLGEQCAALADKFLHLLCVVPDAIDLKRLARRERYMRMRAERQRVASSMASTGAGGTGTAGTGAGAGAGSGRSMVPYRGGGAGMNAARGARAYADSGARVGQEPEEEADELDEELAMPSMVSQLTESVCELMVRFAQLNPGLLGALAGAESLVEGLRRGLLAAEDSSVRNGLLSGLQEMCDLEAQAEQRARESGGAEVKEADRGAGAVLSPALLRELLRLRPRARAFPHNASQLHLLLVSLVRRSAQLPAEVDAGALARELAREIRAHPVLEATDADEDHVLRGTLRLLTALLSHGRLGSAELREALGASRPGSGSGSGPGSGSGAGAGVGDATPATPVVDVGSVGGAADAAALPEVPVREDGEGLLVELFERCLFALPIQAGDAAGAGGAAGGAGGAEETKEGGASSGVGAAEGGGEDDEEEDEEDEEASGPGSVPSRLPPPKCKHQSTRNAAFDLLLALCRGCPANMQGVLSLSLPHHHIGGTDADREKRKRRTSHWDYGLTNLGRSPSGYVGLKNLGCICYMNATLQQMYMVPRFRRQVLAWADAVEDEKESVMFQFQRIFAHLEASEKQYFNPKSFCYAFKDPENPGQPTPVHVQRDASNFLQGLFQQVEAATVGTPHEGILNTFNVFTVSEKFAPGHFSERNQPAEPFIMCQVKGRKGLEASLVGAFAPETVEYSWELADGRKEKLDTQMRVSVKTLPPTLICYLKRFELDYETFETVKLNDNYTFPQELDMYPFTVEGRTVLEGGRPGDADWKQFTGGPAELEQFLQSCTRTLPPEATQYRLMGITIHSGTSRFGHYYSYIRERAPAGQWFEFNDTWVSPFDPERIPLDCFGGSTTYTVAGREYTRTRSSNAFMLFYDRVQPKARLFRAPGAAGAGDAGDVLELRTASVRDRRALVRLFCSSPKSHHKAVARNASGLRHVVRATIRKQIQEENMEFWRRRTVFDFAYFRFLRDLVAGAARGGLAMAMATAGAGAGAGAGALDTAAREAEARAKAAETPLDGVYNSEVVAAAVAGRVGTPNFMLAQLGARFALGTLVQSKARNSLPLWGRIVRARLLHSVPACVWLLTSLARDPDTLRELLAGYQPEPRRATASILAVALQRLAPLEQHMLPGAEQLRGVERLEAMLSPPKSIWPGRLGGGVGSGTPAGGARTAGAATAGAATAAATAGGVGVAGAGSKDAAPPAAAPLALSACELTDSVCVRFFEALVSTVPSLSANTELSDLYDVVASFAECGDAERAFVVGRGTLGAVVSQVESALSAHYLPAPLALMARLVWDAVEGRPAALPREELAVLSDDLFIARVLEVSSKRECAATVRSLAQAACFENDVNTAAWGSALMRSVSMLDGGKLAGPFELLRALLGLQDSLTATRVDALLRQLLETMEGQSRYYRATLVAAQELMETARRQPAVLTWMRENAASLEWLANWMRDNPSPPLPGAGGLALTKPIRGGSLAMAGDEDGGRTPDMLLDDLQAIAGGEPLPRGDYEPGDAPESLRGCRLSLRWESGRWYTGTVVTYNPGNGLHNVLYEDGDDKWYNMRAERFVVLDRPREGEAEDAIQRARTAAQRVAAQYRRSGVGVGVGVGTYGTYPYTALNDDDNYGDDDNDSVQAAPAGDLD